MQQLKNIQWIVFVMISATLLGLTCFPFASEDQISFNKQVKPILNKHCLTCHGGIKKSGDFSLLFEQEAFEKAASGNFPIVRGSSKRSPLIQRVRSDDPEIRMPLDAPPLSDTEITVLEKWIDQGAQWEKHWAYENQLPKHVLPVVESDWPKQDLDYFVFEKLTAHELTPAAEADRRTLIRRLSLDLIGLPPPIEMVDSFVNNTSPAAYEQLVDQILDSPHFAERWASMWLDLARYADTKGYEKDPYRNIWRYRDWVIHAFNQDMPFDQFTIEQLAGDLLSNPTKGQLMATSFHRNTMTNTEGGTEDEEFRVAAVIDRINTTMEVWQGTTIACAQCHSHPYDPFTQKDFYQLYSYLNNTQDADLENEHPVMDFYEPGAQKNMSEIIAFIKSLKPDKNIDLSGDITEQIKQSIFPRLHPTYCDDFQNIQFHGNYWISNWSYRVQAGEKEKYYFKFDDIDLNNLDSIAYTWSTTGDDAMIECRLDSINGLLINRFDCTATKPPGLANLWKDKFETVAVNLEDLSPDLLDVKHDLIFEIINTTGNIPEGIILLSELELKYHDERAINDEQRKANQDLLNARTDRTTLPIMRAKSTAFQRTTHVFDRGNFLVKGESVQPGIPDVMPVINQPIDRLAFAQWLVHPDNKLTARVMVNRFWEQLFGTGLVETLEDFGTMGAAPSHPELLDYLATRFSGEFEWSIKKLLKEIVMSATYRQASIVSQDKLEKDPYNRLLSRGARFRLSAEQIRDQALAVSGLLSDSIGGPSVMPFQPEGVWASVYSGAKWTTSKGKERYRRGLYTFWKRTAPYPSMLSFDSPSREYCVSRRIRTNTPLQALVTLNDPVYIEAANALAMRMEQEADLKEAIGLGYKLALSKEISDDAFDVLKALYVKASNEFGKAKLVANSDTEKKLLSPMAVVANAILNLDGFIMKE